MGILDWLKPKAEEPDHQPKKTKGKVKVPPKNQGSDEVKAKKPRKPRKPAAKAEPAQPAEKLEATAKGEPWVSVVSVELDPDNLGNGAFELDFNEIFVARLVKAGYKGKTDHDVVDNWFTDICRNVVMENFEQWEANHPNDSPRAVHRKDLGGGRTEVS